MWKVGEWDIGPNNLQKYVKMYVIFTGLLCYDLY